MGQFKKLFVGVDFSTPPFVLDTAAGIARASGAELVLHHVIDSSELERYLATHVGAGTEEVSRSAEKQLESLAAKLSDGIDRVSVSVSTGRPANTLAEAAEASGCDLAVLSNRDDSGRGLGSVSSGMVRRAKCDVLLLRESSSPTIRSVAVGVDFSDTSLVAVARAAAIARAAGARLEVIHVIYPPDLDFYGNAFSSDKSPGTDGAAPSAAARANAGVERFLEPLREELEGLDYAIKVIASRFPGIALTSHLEQSKTDLVAIGTTGRTKILGLKLGSNAERLIRDTPCSVLAVKKR